MQKNDTLLYVEGLTKHYGSLSAINGVNFELSPGEILGIIGPNGAGKTTLFNCIMGVERPSNGKILFNGTEITGLKPHKITRLGLAKTAQITQPFQHMSVFENVLINAMYSAGKSMQEATLKVNEILNQVGLSFISDKPASSISVSERRRLELAKCLAGNPLLLLLDENMAGLNPTETMDALEIVREVRDSGISIIMVEHVMKVVMTVSDRILVLNHGSIIAEGTPDEITRNRKVITAYFGEKHPTEFCS